MTLLIVGLLLFLGVHSVRIVAEDFRSRQIARLGTNGWKGLYTLASLAGFALIVWGFGVARQQPVALWPSPAWLRHMASLLTLVAFVFVVAAYVPGNGIKARLQHPMVLGVKAWAFAHLIANNTLADLLLFGSFLVWAHLQLPRGEGARPCGGHDLRARHVAAHVGHRRDRLRGLGRLCVLGPWGLDRRATVRLTWAACPRRA